VGSGVRARVVRATAATACVPGAPPTTTQPRAVTAVAGYDALSHAVETAVTTRRTALSSLFSREAFRLLDGAYERVLDAPQDVAARGDMLLGSFYAGLAVESSMLGAAHEPRNRG